MGMIHIAILKPSSPLWDQRYKSLDSWRGLAAVAVVVHHALGIMVGHIAVMLFFVISGYCITASAESCLKKEMGFGQYMWRRIRRIYPPYLFSVFYYVATRAVKIMLMGENDLNRFSAIAWVQNLTLTQWFSLMHWPMADAADNRTNMVAVYWSLNYEEQLYLIVAVMMAISLVWVGSFLRLFFSLAAVVAVLNVMFPQVCIGLFTDYWVHFAVGSLVYCRLTKVHGRRGRLAIDGVIGLIMAGSAWAWWLSGIDWSSSRRIYHEWFVVSAFAGLLILLRPLDQVFSGAWVGRQLGRLGLISYSLYLIHQCNLQLVEMFVGVVTGHRSVGYLQSALVIVMHIAVAVVFWYFCERPFLNKPVATQG